MGRFDGKTEKATPRKRREARREGQVAKSPEVAVAASLLGTAIAVKVLGPASISVFADTSRTLFATAGTGQAAMQELGPNVLTAVAATLAPFLAVAVFAGVSANVAQVGFRITPKAAQPKLSKISPKQGLERLKPATAAWELVRSTLKLGLLVAVAWAPMAEFLEVLTRPWSLAAGVDITVDRAVALLVRIAGVMLLIAAADYAVNRYKHERKLKMSKEDIKQEHKQSEGDPMVKSQRRRRAQDLSRNRMLMAVGGADVVLTNPTHLAIAIRYDGAEGAPRVVAKGADRIAAKIRKEAYRHGVPVIENKPLARALFKRVKVDGFVPVELYEAVAVVLATVYRRRSRKLALA